MSSCGHTKMASEIRSSLAGFEFLRLLTACYFGLPDSSGNTKINFLRCSLWLRLLSQNFDSRD